jgi:hypothetical protein
VWSAPGSLAPATGLTAEALVLPKLGERTVQPLFPTARRPKAAAKATCTMRVIDVDPLHDAGILGPTPAARIDPGIRGTISPCLP